MSRDCLAAVKSALKSVMVSPILTPFLALAAPRDLAEVAGTAALVAREVTTERTSG
ncbi:hypothetical protein GCM10010212_24250 [Paenarthrobacter nicotinovorans]|nr:hypothetical protein GCM10010212_24250 [Paenarthrobacter nicotinovorans]